MAQVESLTWLEFMRERGELMEPKPGQTTRYLAEELVRLMELLAVHGYSGIEGNPDTREAYVQRLQGRISTAREPIG